jgi:hypothetical protein
MDGKMAKKSAFLPHPKGKKTSITADLSFYISADMLLPEEIHALHQGNMTIERAQLMNLNAPKSVVKLHTGEKTKLYPGRATKIKALRLIGRDV